MQVVGDIADAHCAANRHGIGSRIDLYGLEVAQIDLDSVLQLAQRPCVAMAAAGGEKGDVVIRSVPDLRGRWVNQLVTVLSKDFQSLLTTF